MRSIAVRRWLSSSFAIGTAMLVLLQARPSAAHEVELGIAAGQISSRGGPATAYVARRVAAAWEFNDSFQLSSEFSATHYGATARASGFDSLRLAAAADWEVTRHWTLMLDGYVAPVSSRELTTQYDDASSETTRIRRSGQGAVFAADYELAPETAFDTTIGAVLGEVAWTEHEHVDARPWSAETIATRTAVLQLKFGLNLTQKLIRTHELSLMLDHYVYAHTAASRAAAQLPLAAATLDTIQLFEPLENSVRLQLAQRVGVLRFSAYGQLGRYSERQGWGTMVGCRATAQLSSRLLASLGAGLQQQFYADGDRWSLAWLSLDVWFFSK